MLAHDLFHPVFQVKLVLFQALLFNFLVRGKKSLGGELGEPLLVVVMITQEGTKFLVLALELMLDVLRQGLHRHLLLVKWFNDRSLPSSPGGRQGVVARPISGPSRGHPRHRGSNSHGGPPPRSQASRKTCGPACSRTSPRGRSPRRSRGHRTREPRPCAPKPRPGGESPGRRRSC